MALITGQDLIDAGYAPGPQFRELLAAAAKYEERGITDRDYVLKLLNKRHVPAPAKETMREKGAPFTEAIAPKNAEEEVNVAAVRRQMTHLLRSPVLVRGAVMPDACPAGAGAAVIPVGGAIAARNAIIPSAHSADICCSMYATFYRSQDTVGKELDALVSATRFGMGGRRPDDLAYHPVIEEEVWGNCFLCGLRESARIHLADQGDGNHFAYLGEVRLDAVRLDALRGAGYGEIAEALAGKAGPGQAGAESESEARTYRVLVTHHGSRGLGARLYKRGQIAATKHTARVAQGIPSAAAWLDAASEEGAAYWEALQYVARWTRANHEAIHRRFLEKTGAQAAAEFGNEHNFVWKDGDIYLHGKGATPAWRDERGRPLLGLIPLNMAAPILIVLGGNNDEFLSFAPHGAGRNVSRTALKRRFPDEASRLRTIAESTEGIDVRWFCGQPDLSETPVAYKDAEDVRAQIEQFGLAEVVAEIRPLGCIMAGEYEGPAPWMRREEELTPKQKRQMEHRAGRRRNRRELRGEF
ncbi:MAG TPA: RtcB family protein [Verrucomicrobiales bacterium]|nr:RtcB family protein [Verrucomicrobiales bacterium]